MITSDSSGQIFYGHEDETLNKVTIEQLLSHLKSKEQETIILWSQGKTLEQIAIYISVKYEGRNEDNPLSARAMGVRVHKILDKLRKLAKGSNN